MQTKVPAGAGYLWAEDSGDPGGRPGAGGPPLILLHSGVADARLWDPVWPALTRQFRVIRYDSRGYSRSPAATAPYTHLDDLHAVLDHFGVDVAHLVGCSQGGGTATEFALSQPGRVASLVLLAPGFDDYPWPANAELDATWAALKQAGDFDGLVALSLDTWGGSGADPLVTDLMRASLRAEASEEQWLRPAGPVFTRLEQLTVPTLIMTGDRDARPLIDSNQRAAQRIPGATFIQLPGVDHYPPVREPAAVIEAIAVRCGNPVPWAIRPARAGDRPFLEDMLVEAVNWSPTWNQSKASVLATPAQAHYVAGWPRDRDLGVIAEAAGQPVGACWLRFWPPAEHGYGFIAPGVPELSIGVAPLWRGRGIGRALLRAAEDAARAVGIERISLSVERANHAQRLYRAEGYEVVDAGGKHADTMAKNTKR